MATVAPPAHGAGTAAGGMGRQSGRMGPPVLAALQGPCNRVEVAPYEQWQRCPQSASPTWAPRRAGGHPSQRRCADRIASRVGLLPVSARCRVTASGSCTPLHRDRRWPLRVTWRPRPVGRRPGSRRRRASALSNGKPSPHRSVAVVADDPHRIPLPLGTTHTVKLGPACGPSRWCSDPGPVGGIRADPPRMHSSPLPPGGTEQQATSWREPWSVVSDPNPAVSGLSRLPQLTRPPTRCRARFATASSSSSSRSGTGRTVTVRPREDGTFDRDSRATATQRGGGARVARLRCSFIRRPSIPAGQQTAAHRHRPAADEGAAPAARRAAQRPRRADR